MKICNTKALLNIVGYSNLISWIRLSPKIFYKDGKPFGAIGIKLAGHTAYIASTTKDPDIPFTFSMNRYLLEINKKFDIIVITDMPEYQTTVRKWLGKHGFTFTYDGDTMYSKRGVHNG